MKQLKLVKNQRTIRCQKCYRIHDIEVISINNVLSIGYRCFKHPRALEGHYFFAKYPFEKTYGNHEFVQIKGIVKNVRDGWYEYRPSTNEKTEIVYQTSFL